MRRKTLLIFGKGTDGNMKNTHGGKRPNSGRKKSKPTTKMVSMRFPIEALKKINADRNGESLVKFLLRKAGYEMMIDAAE